MKRDTSIQAYEEIKEEGLLGRRSQEVERIFEQHGPLTSKQLCAIAYPNTTGNFPGVQARIAELCKKNKLRPLEKVRCEKSGRMVWRWDIASRVPDEQYYDLISKLPLTVKQAQVKIRALEDELVKVRAENSELKFRLSRKPELRAARPGSIEFEMQQANLFPEESE